MLTYYELDLGLNHVVRKWSDPVDARANMLFPGINPSPLQSTLSTALLPLNLISPQKPLFLQLQFPAAMMVPLVYSFVVKTS